MFILLVSEKQSVIQEPGSSHSSNNTAESVAAGPDMQAFAEAACQQVQHISPQTATSTHDGRQHKQGPQCMESFSKLGPEPATCTAAFSAIHLAADSIVGGRAGSAADSSTVGVGVADCSASAKSSESDAADAAVPAVSSRPCADTDRSAIRTAAAEREPSVSSRGGHAAEGKPAGAADALDPEEQKKRCGCSAQGIDDLDLNAGKMASKQHTLLGKDQFGSEVAVHGSSLAPPASGGSLGSQVLGSLFCCPITRVRLVRACHWLLLFWPC